MLYVRRWWWLAVICVVVLPKSVDRDAFPRAGRSVSRRTCTPVNPFFSRLSPLLRRFYATLGASGHRSLCSLHSHSSLLKSMGITIVGLMCTHPFMHTAIHAVGCATFTTGEIYTTNGLLRSAGGCYRYSWSLGDAGASFGSS